MHYYISLLLWMQTGIRQKHIEKILHYEALVQNQVIVLIFISSCNLSKIKKIKIFMSTAVIVLSSV